MSDNSELRMTWKTYNYKNIEKCWIKYNKNAWAPKVKRANQQGQNTSDTGGAAALGYLLEQSKATVLMSGWGGVCVWEEELNLSLMCSWGPWKSKPWGAEISHKSFSLQGNPTLVALTLC